MIYESTRDINRKLNPSEAILQGLSEEGGLFVLRDLGKNKLDLEKLIGKSYYEVAEAVLRLFVDFSDEEIKKCVEEAYRGKFSHENITPLVELKDGHILELFNGPTSAFKDVGLSLLPQLTTSCDLLPLLVQTKAPEKMLSLLWHSPPRQYLHILTMLLI